MPAPQPDQTPESLIVGQFAGVKNTVTRERLTDADLEKAVNVDLDDAGQLHRRRGYSLKLAGDTHSLKLVGGRVLVVKDGYLGQLYPDYTFAPYAVASPDRISYTQIGETTYFSSLTFSGKLQRDTVSGWGQTGGDGTWLSPVIAPTSTLGEIAGQLLAAPPMASEIEYYRGRVYMASGSTIWCTELYLYDLVDRTRTYMQFESDVTLMAAVDDGIYVGTQTGIFFLGGDFAGGFKLQKMSDASAIAGSKTVVPASRLKQLTQSGTSAEDFVPVFLTSDGVVAGYESGQLFNLTQGRIVLPEATSAAALYREDSGVSSYLAVMDSSGGPSANARIGDFVDAEIVRFQGG